MRNKFALVLVLLAAVTWCWSFTVSEAQNSSFSGENLLTADKSNSLVTGDLAVESKTDSKKADLTTDFVLPIHNGVVDLSDKTHVRVYSNGASLQMQY